MKIIRSTQNRIYEIRGKRVMIDRDLAALFGLDINIINLAIKRHSKGFTNDFIFQLTKEEWESIRLQMEKIESSHSLRPKTITVKNGGEQNSKFLPYAFTGEGVAILKDILSSDENATESRELDDAMENLLDENAGQKKWGERERIGFKA